MCSSLVFSNFNHTHTYTHIHTQCTLYLIHINVQKIKNDYFMMNMCELKLRNIHYRYGHFCITVNYSWKSKIAFHSVIFNYVTLNELSVCYFRWKLLEIIFYNQFVTKNRLHIKTIHFIPFPVRICFFLINSLFSTIIYFFSLLSYCTLWHSIVFKSVLYDQFKLANL